MSEAYERRVELAHERGFDSPYYQDKWVAHERETFGDIGFNEALTLAQFERDYDAGDMSRDELAEWYEENIGEIDWEDPEDPFWDWLDALSGPE